MSEFLVPQAAQGQRLDQVLALLLPGTSLRQRRRLWDDSGVLVDGTARPKGFRVRAGQRIALLRNQARDRTAFSREDWPEVRVIHKQNGYAALLKPAGLHTACLASSQDPSLEEGLACFFTEPGVRLLNRLDRLTSGLVLVGLSPERGAAYHELQQRGEVLKYYLAVCRGHVGQDATVRQRIDSAGNKKVRVTPEEDPDPLRRTRIEPMAYDLRQDVSLVRALILKGGRHQIRAHLAWLGHPLANDPLYDQKTGDSARLFHYHIEFPGFLCSLEPNTHFFKKDEPWRLR